MSDILIRDVPDDVTLGIDALADRAGISRAEYVRRALKREAVLASGQVTTLDDLRRLSQLTADMRESDFEARSWGHGERVAD